SLRGEAQLGVGRGLLWYCSRVRCTSSSAERSPRRSYMCAHGDLPHGWSAGSYLPLTTGTSTFGCVTHRRSPRDTPPLESPSARLRLPPRGWFGPSRSSLRFGRGGFSHWSPGRSSRRSPPFWSPSLQR